MQLLFCSLSVQAEKLVVYTVNYPLQYFTQRIGGNAVEVHFPAPRNIDPAFWMPDAKIINAYQQADLIILNGAGYAKWVNKVSLPRLRQVNTSKPFEQNFIKVKQGLTHQHGPAGEHSHTGTAFTTWLDFNQAIQQANVIYEALVRKSPEQINLFKDNFNALKKDLLTLDTELLKLSPKVQNNWLLASHPVYQYFARRYNLRLIEVTWEPNEFPVRSQWTKLEQKLTQSTEHWMLWEAQPIQKTEKELTKMGIAITVFEPCMNVPEQGDFLSVMRKNIKNLSGVFQ